MGDNGPPLCATECALLWKLARTHGWSRVADVHDLVADANVDDEAAARDIARNRLAERTFIGFHQGRDEIWLEGPPPVEVFYRLRDDCGFTELQIEATFSSYLDRF